MADPVALSLALLMLGATLAAAVIRPTHGTEAVAAGAGALLLMAVGAISWTQAGRTISELGPTVGFLAALLLIAEGCRRDGLFVAIGDLVAWRSRGDARRLLGLVFVVASAVTIVLGLDATVVLVSPIVIATALRLRAGLRAPAYACVHLANSASLLLPISNLTNLLAFHASGLSFVRFALLMALPTAAAIALEWLVISNSFPAERAPARPPRSAPEQAPLPWFALVVLALTLAGFALSSAFSIEPVWIAVAGAAALNLPAVVTGRSRPLALVGAAEPGFLLFVLGLGVIVAAASEHGLSAAIRDIVPAGGSLPDLLLVAAISALLANVVNNIPATLILLPVVAGFGYGPVLAMLVGVNIGPNLTQVGSLATLLWRRVLATEGVALRDSEFVALGLRSVPAALVAATALLWLVLQL